MIHQLNIVKKTMKGYKKRLVKGLKSFQKEEKSKNMNANNIKLSPKMKNKGRMLAVH